jgi:hypothetical protein
LGPPDSTPANMPEAHHIITKTIVETAFLSLHEDLKRQATTSTHTPLFTGHGPVQTGVSFNLQSAATPSGTIPKGASASTSVGSSGAKTQTGTASASAPTHSSAASLLSAGSWGLGLWSGVQLLRVMVDSS